MSTIFGIGGAGGAFGTASVAVRERSRALVGPDHAAVRYRQDLTRFDGALRVLRRDLEALRDHGATAPVGRTVAAREAGPARAASTSALALDPIATFTTVRSTEEVNTRPTSFTPFGPVVTGTSTTLPTLGRFYDGDQGDDVLTFQFLDTAVVGSNDRLRVRMFDGEGNAIATRDFRNRAPGSTRRYNNGLELALSAGLAVAGDTFQVSVSTSVGSRVDPTKPFDGVRNDNPNFEWGDSVTAGSFEVNGVSIAVAANDSIDSVLARIGASGAGVDAAFDAATESVVLTQRTPGSAAHVVLANDTSGFLAATKLGGATEVPGLDGGDPIDEPIATMPELAGVTSGTFLVNGVAISVDVNVDSLGDVLDRVNGAGAGAAATLDPGSRRVEIVATDPQGTLSLADAGTGLLAALRLVEGDYQPTEARDARRGDGPGFRREGLVRDDLRAVGRGLGSVLAGLYAGVPGGELAGLRGRLTGAVGQTFAAFFDGMEGPRLRSGYGIDFDLRAGAERPFTLDGERLGRALDDRFEEVHAFLFGSEAPDGPQGLIAALLESLAPLQETVALRLGHGGAGGLVDLRV